MRTRHAGTGSRRRLVLHRHSGRIHEPLSRGQAALSHRCRPRPHPPTVARGQALGQAGQVCRCAPAGTGSRRVPRTVWRPSAARLAIRGFLLHHPPTPRAWPSDRRPRPTRRRRVTETFQSLPVICNKNEIYSYCPTPRRLPDWATGRRTGRRLAAVTRKSRIAKSSLILKFLFYLKNHNS